MVGLLMIRGTCLCGKIRWSFSDRHVVGSHCHCSMCRKAHGAAFATYYQVDAKDFHWDSELDTLQEYRSSPDIVRSFCSDCGSVVPNNTQGDETIYLPAGSNDDGPAARAHIFTASKAPWHEITDNLPQFAAYMTNDDGKIYPDKELAPRMQGIVRGSCLCDAVQFQVTEPFKIIHNCHCSRCRRARAAAFTTNGFTSIDAVDFIKGESNIKLYKVPEAEFFTHAFCDQCGSGVPRKDPGRGIAVIPLGALDDDPGSSAADHIYVQDKAHWYDITDDLPAFAQMPE